MVTACENSVSTRSAIGMSYTRTSATALLLRTMPRRAATIGTTETRATAATSPACSVVTGEAVALHRGRSTQVWQTTVTNADGKLCAVVTQTQLILSPQPA